MKTVGCSHNVNERANRQGCFFLCVSAKDIMYSRSVCEKVCENVVLYEFVNTGTPLRPFLTLSPGT